MTSRVVDSDMYKVSRATSLSVSQCLCTGVYIVSVCVCAWLRARPKTKLIRLVGDKLMSQELWSSCKNRQDIYLRSDPLRYERMVDVCAHRSSYRCWLVDSGSDNIWTSLLADRCLSLAVTASWLILANERSRLFITYIKPAIFCPMH